MDACYRIAVKSLEQLGTVIVFIDMEGDLVLIIAERAEAENKEELYCVLNEYNMRLCMSWRSLSG